ncbi:MAG: RHS repeat-associated core domain-containing protein, partial [Bacteroidales bacterium]|nr:RHS repeat-associated core domain-containing protein [Bacteroidales bacterium]
KGPKEIQAGKPYTIRYQYNNAVIDTDTYVLLQPASTYTFNYDPEYPTNDIEVFTYSDGLGRVVQTKKDAEVNGVEKMIVSGRVIFDAFGRTVASYYPTEQNLGDTTYCNDTDNVTPTITDYDILDRPLTLISPDQIEHNFEYGFGNDNNGHVLFQLKAIDPKGYIGYIVTDVNGLKYGMKPAGEEWVYFSYDIIGQCLSVFSSQSNDFIRTYNYDWLGRATYYNEGQLKEYYTYLGANIGLKNIEWYNTLSNSTENKSIEYHFEHNRLMFFQSTEYQSPTEFAYDDANAHGELVAIKDESGIQTFEYGTMGEIVKSTRAYALPTQAAPIALSTQFEYDSWGRMKNITYPDGEVLTYSYDHGGQLKKMKGRKDNIDYVYLDTMCYDKFGDKTWMGYGNNVKTSYTYNPLNLRLTNITVKNQQQTQYSSMDYTYDVKGNVTQLNSTYSCFYGNNPIAQTFTYDSTDQLTSALGQVGQNSIYSVSVNYNNWGKIGRYTSSMNGSDTFMYPTTNLTSTHFAPESSVNNGQTTNYDFGINGSLRRKENNEATEYYLFNAFNCMKAYSYNAERYGYYGYDASGERTYKMDINFLGVWTNELEEISDNWEMEKMMLYPNGYLNMNQNGEYTKHYYADALRIASKIGSGFDGNICDSVIEIENDYPNYLDDRMTDQNTIMMSELYETTQLASPQGTLNFINPYEDICNLGSGGQETGLFFYHPDHLGSTGMVTDVNANITQGLLYAPFGEIINEYGGLNNNVIPKYAFNAKEFDEENGMYYYSARYYAPPTFISRDPMFEIDPTFSPYTYCGNNPIKYSDPTGKYKIDKTLRQQCPRLAEYLESQKFKDYVMKNPAILNALKTYGQFQSDEEILKVLGSEGPLLISIDRSGIYDANGYYSGGKMGCIYIASDIIEWINSAKSDEEMAIALLWVIDILFHETCHYGDWQDGVPYNNRAALDIDGKIEIRYEKDGTPYQYIQYKIPEVPEVQYLFETDVFFNKVYIWGNWMQTHDDAVRAFKGIKTRKQDKILPSF